MGTPTTSWYQWFDTYADGLGSLRPRVPSTEAGRGQGRVALRLRRSFQRRRAVRHLRGRGSRSFSDFPTTIGSIRDTLFALPAETKGAHRSRRRHHDRHRVTAP